MLMDSRFSAIHMRAIEAQEEFFKLLHKQIHSLVPKSKWFTSDHVALNDLVLFFFDDSNLKPWSRPWHVGWVRDINGSRLIIEYNIGMSDTKKVIERSKRDCCRISAEDELIFNSHEHMQKLLSK